MGDIPAEAKANAAARTGVDKAVHGPGEKGVLPIDELRQEADIALLGALPCDQVRGSGSGTTRCSCRMPARRKPMSTTCA